MFGMNITWLLYLRIVGNRRLYYINYFTSGSDAKPTSRSSSLGM